MKKSKCTACGAVIKGDISACLLCGVSLSDDTTQDRVPVSNNPGAAVPDPPVTNPQASVPPVYQQPPPVVEHQVINTPKTGRRFGLGCFVIGLFLVLAVVAGSSVGGYLAWDYIARNGSEASPTPASSPSTDYDKIVNDPADLEPIEKPEPSIKRTPSPTPAPSANPDDFEDLLDDIFEDEVPKNPVQKGRRAFAVGSNVSMRNAPSLSAKRIGSLSFNEEVTVVGTSNHTTYWKYSRCKWARVRTKNGTQGWVFGYFITGVECPVRDGNH